MRAYREHPDRLHLAASRRKARYGMLVLAGLPAASRISWSTHTAAVCMQLTMRNFEQRTPLHLAAMSCMPTTVAEVLEHINSVAWPEPAPWRDEDAALYQHHQQSQKQSRAQVRLNMCINNMLESKSNILHDA